MTSTIRSDLGPYTLVPEWLLDAEVSDRAKVLYALLGRYADDDGRAFPARRTLAKRLRCSVDSIDRATRELTDAGFLLVEPRYEATEEARRQTSNDYVLVRHPGRTAAAGSSGTAAAGPGRTAAAPGTRTSSEREPVELELAATSAAAAYDPLKGTKIDGRNLPWDALVKETSADERTEGGRLGQALKIIRRVVVEDSSPQTFEDPATGEWHIARQIGARAALYRRRWPNVELTPTALASNWSRVVTAQPGSDPLATLDAAQRGIDEARRTA